MSDNVYSFECNILLFQEPSCRICTRLIPRVAFDPYTLQSSYKSPVMKRKEYYYEPRRHRAFRKVDTDLNYEFNSRVCNADCAVHKNQELKRNVQDLDRPMCHGEKVIC